MVRGKERADQAATVADSPQVLHHAAHRADVPRLKQLLNKGGNYIEFNPLNFSVAESELVGPKLFET